MHARVLEILRNTVGEEHRDYAAALSNRAGLLEKQVRAVRTFPENSCDILWTLLCLTIERGPSLR